MLVEEALSAAAPLAEAKRITLAVELIDPPRLEADPERIFRVLSNLLGNAIKFSAEGAAITVRAERRGDELLISVIDTGPGIAADDLPHLFDRYWKAQPGEPGAERGWASTSPRESSRRMADGSGPSPRLAARGSLSRCPSRAELDARRQMASLRRSDSFAPDHAQDLRMDSRRRGGGGFLFTRHGPRIRRSS